MTVEIELQVATNAKTLPHPSQIKEWIAMIFSSSILSSKNLLQSDQIELTIRVVNEEEIADLNYRYRNKIGPTNVLSFSVEDFPSIVRNEFNYYQLGDIVICASIVEQEAKEQNKELLSHWAHMVIHGTLHLLGYDHENSYDANKMENIEIKLMKKLGFVSPY